MSALESAEIPLLPRLLAGLRDNRPLSLGEHATQYGLLDLRHRPQLRELLEQSGLQGRGGGSFPVARKLAAVAAHRQRPVVLVNAVEGEPLSGKDKVLLRHLPHLVLDGAVLLAAELRAREVVVAVADRAGDERRALAAALAERSAARIDGGVAIEVAVVPSRFVAGEETAVVNFLNGGRTVPTATPPRPFDRGINGRPTLVQNAETVAHVAQIARFGARWFRELGTAAEPGTSLFTVTGAVARPGVHEAPHGIALRELVELARGVTARPQAFLVGGYFGSWFSPADAATVTLEERCLRPRGGGLGARAVHVLGPGQDGLAFSARIARYLADESAGQCGPCVHGLAAIAEALERLALRDDPAARARIERWCAQVGGRGACRHPDGAVRFISSALGVFGRRA